MLHSAALLCYTKLQHSSSNIALSLNYIFALLDCLYSFLLVLLCTLLHSAHSTLWCCSLHSFYREIAVTISLSLSLFRILRLRETAFLNINFNKCQPKVHTQFQHLISTISGQKYPNLQVVNLYDFWRFMGYYPM